MIFLYLFLSIARAESVNQVLSAIQAKHTVFGNNPVIFSKEIKTSSSHHLLMKFKSDNTFFDFDILIDISPKKAEEIAISQSKFTSILYNNKPSPYAGVLSNNLECSSKFLPKEEVVTINNTKTSIYKSFAGKNFQLGVCNKDDFYYWVCTTNFYDGKNLQIIKTFTPKTNNINCKNTISKYIFNYEKTKI